MDGCYRSAMKLAGPVIYDGVPLCQTCMVQHEGPCPHFPEVVRPCPCSYHLTDAHLLCPTTAHEAWKAHKEKNS